MGGDEVGVSRWAGKVWAVKDWWCLWAPVDQSVEQDLEECRDVC